MRGIIRGPELIVGAAALVVAACGGEDDSEGSAVQAAQAGQAPAVVVAQVATEDVPIFRDFVARTTAVNTVEVQARVEAVLQSREFEEGKRVEEGQLLYQLDSRTYRANVAVAQARSEQAAANLKLAMEQVSVRAAEAGLVRTQAQLKKAQQDVARLEPLAAKDAVPRQDLDTALAAEEVAQAEVDAQQATLENSRIQEEVGLLMAQADVEAAAGELELAQLNLEYCTISSPIAGLIGRTEEDVGSLVGRGEATLLGTVSSIDPIYVTFSVSEAEYLRFMEDRRKRGLGEEDPEPTPIELLLADDSTYEFPGAVAFADRAVDMTTGTLELIASFPNPEGLLRPGQFGRCRMQVDLLEGAVLVPQRAIMEQQGAKFVFVVDENSVVSLRGVEVVERSGHNFVLAGGVEAGETVIVEGQLKARPGSPVKPMDEAVSAEPTQDGE